MEALAYLRAGYQWGPAAGALPIVEVIHAARVTSRGQERLNKARSKDGAKS